MESRASPARPLPYLAGRAVRRLRNMTGRFRIIDLQDVREGDLPRVGRKALHLGVMMRAGFTVPRGFVIPTAACEEAIRSSGEQIELDEQLQAAIVAAYRARGFQRVAVRSSATLEDLRHASFAGIYTTRVNVASEVELIQAVVECLRSLRAPRTALYRQQVSLEENGCGRGMAVLVQEMVEAEVSGVIYTLNPVTFSRDECVVNAVFGLGEPLVSGLVPGDTFRVDRKGQVLETRIVAKDATLTPTQLCGLVDVGIALETLFGHPQDIEFAIAGRQTHILQSRPISATSDSLERKAARYRQMEIDRLRRRIAGLRRKGKLTCGEAIYSDGNIAEILPTPTPMSFGIFTTIFSDEGGIQLGRRRLGYTLADETSEGLFELICGHPYFNLELDAKTFQVDFPLDITAYLNQVKAEPHLANYPEIGLYQQELTLDEAVGRFGPDKGRKYHDRFLEFLSGMIRWGEAYHTQFSDTIEPELQSYLTREEPVALTGLSCGEIIAKLQGYLDHLRWSTAVHYVVAARLGFFFTDRVKRQLQGWFGLEADGLIEKLLHGLERSKIGREEIDLLRLAQKEMSREEFLATYGHLAANELEIAMPRMADDSQSLERLLRKAVATDYHPTVESFQQVERRERAEAEVRNRMAQSGASRLDIRTLFKNLEYAQRYLPFRETIKYYLVAEYALIRRALMVLGRKLELEPDEVFYLFPTELPELLSDLKRARDTIQVRRKEREIALLFARRKWMPRVIFENSLEEIGRPPRLDTSQEFQAVPVSSGEAVGRVRIIDPDRLDSLSNGNGLQAHDVIVVPAVSLGMFLHIRGVAGLVMETGGILAHGACLARESGVPAVILENASLLLPDKSQVRIDGSSGKVSLLNCPISPERP
ncbi:PEP/pyruvate-binding domain-containing protein [Candidatus Methylomirabilis sp.]|uniref:PEP/pyruvate-binding domain-containing protein n=1 Tax=Candidatus Methylomirabilis sp. TaxID=2032687 RepID=UPI002A5B7DFE|nr:PEP/pyruvate-binding domain-containing protein [Candidatus Methylomirabilis sp.]